MSISKHLDKENLHHAYLIEGAREEATEELFKFLNDLGVSTSNNSDFIHLSLDSFKIEDARNLKSYGNQKGFSAGKKVFVISANSFLLEAQNSLLKMFEEPIENTHFFVIVPDVNTLLKTFVSRFYFISHRSDLWENGDGDKEAKKFLALPLKNRIDFIKELLTDPEEEGEDGNEIIVINSPRAKALKFLNSLESVMAKSVSKRIFDIGVFEHIFKVREFLRMPGSSPKTLMESVALIVPVC